jgi:hypothetical protein
MLPNCEGTPVNNTMVHERCRGTNLRFLEVVHLYLVESVAFCRSTQSTPVFFLRESMHFHCHPVDIVAAKHYLSENDGKVDIALL